MIHGNRNGETSVEPRAKPKARSFRWFTLGLGLSVLVWALGEKLESRRERRVLDQKIAKLIDRLADLQEFRGSGSVFRHDMLILPKPFQAVVVHGVRALPQLLADVDDPRPTRLVFGDSTAARRSDGVWVHREALTLLCYQDTDYDSRFVDSRFPLTFRSPQRKPRLTPVSQYTVRIGDLCYLAIGAIVNRRLLPYWDQPTKVLLIDAPSLNMDLSRAVRADWHDLLTEDQHHRSLVADLAHPWRIEAALTRLWFFYPTHAKGAVLRLLSAPPFDESAVWTLTKTQLLETETPAHWRKVLDRLPSLEQLEVRTSLIQTYNDPTSSGVHRVRAKKVLINCYPDCDLVTVPFPAVSSLSHYVAAVETLPPETFADRDINGALAIAFRCLDFDKYISSDSKRLLDRFAFACMRRLVGMGSREDFARYCRKRVNELIGASQPSEEFYLRRQWSERLEWVQNTPEATDPRGAR